MKKRIYLFLTVAFLILFGISCQGSTSPKTTESPAVEQAAEDFMLMDLEGNNVRLSDFRGKQAVVLVFSATWCYYCNKEIPELKKIYQKYDNKGIKVLAAYIREGKESLLSYAQQNSIPYTILLDINGSVSSLYNVYGIPTIFVIDKNGIIRHIGQTPSAALLDEVSK